MAKNDGQKPFDIDETIAGVISNVNKAFADDSKIQRAQDIDFITGLDFISTGNYAINYICTGNPFKAFARGRIISLVGDSGSGKSLLLNHCLAENQKIGGISIVFDVERGNYTNHLTNIGIDLKRLIVSPEKIIENMIEKTIFMIKKLRETNKDIPILIGWDSLSQASTRHEIEKGLDKVDMARAKVIRAGLRIVNSLISDTNACLIMVNHQTTNMDAMNPKYAAPHEKYSTPGGTAVEFFPSQIVRVNKGKVIKDEITKNPLGIEINVSVEKSRFYIPFIKLKVEISFDKGFSPASGLFDILWNKQFIESPKQGYYNFKDEPEKMYHGVQKIKDLISEDPEKYAKLIMQEIQAAPGDIFADDADNKEISTDIHE